MKPVIIGAGLAGLTTALSLAPMPVILLSPKPLGDECSSSWAQGGISAALGSDDNPALHAEDTLVAGAGLCNPAIVNQVTGDGADVVARLVQHAVPFDRNAQGEIALGLEAAHSRRRIVHAKGDGTGAAIMKALVAAARATPSIEIIEGAIADDLLTDNGRIAGVAGTRNDERFVLRANAVVLATGGAGALWRHTTNPLGSWGRGLALAARAGALLGDLEFMQFHPTAIDVARDPMPLASEALRGEGCILVDEKGERFMAGYARAELEPRDVVARAIWNHIGKGRRTFLDARAAIGEKFAQRFPAIHALCVQSHIDPAHHLIPVRPAAHYHMGGVVTDANGRTSVEGLWACGEVASTGLHGANRLASNSLLEAASFGRRVAEDIAGIPASAVAPKPFIMPRYRTQEDHAVQVREAMSAHVGVLRDRAGLEQAVKTLAPLSAQSDRALVGLMISAFALQREESRGAHARTDFPKLASKPHRKSMTLADITRVTEKFTEFKPVFAAGA